jgi:menaquinone-dependent protoporphyrinogen oxidase
MRALIAYGSKMGGTSGVAQMLGDALHDDGLVVDVLPASLANHVEDYDAVIVGSALYAARWQRDARRFLKHNTARLRERPVFLFSTGPLDDSATEKEIPPTHQVQRLMARVGAVEHVTFGGRLPEDAAGFPASAMAKDHAGDWRDPDQIRGWAHHVASYLREQAAV